MINCTCGAEMEPISTAETVQRSVLSLNLSVPNIPPRHRKRRIAKKWARKYAIERQQLVAFIALMMAPVRMGHLRGFRCKSCNAQIGGYQAIARSMFSIQPMPTGAVAYYDRDLGVAELAVPKSISEDEKRRLLEKALLDRKSRTTLGKK